MTLEVEENEEEEFHKPKATKAINQKTIKEKSQIDTQSQFKFETLEVTDWDVKDIDKECYFQEMDNSKQQLSPEKEDRKKKSSMNPRQQK